MKATTPKPKVEVGPVTVEFPHQPDRLAAIKAIAESNLILARALEAQPHVTVQDCIVKTAENGTGIAINSRL